MNGKCKIVVMERNTLGDDVSLDALKKFGEVVTYPLSDPKENAVRIQDADIVIVNKIPMNEETLGNAKKVKLISLTATGTNNVDFAYTNARGITVANVKGYSTDSVVQHTFALLFYVYEKLSYYDRFVKSGAYAVNDVFSHFTVPFRELAGKTWGIIGLGAIGTKVGEIAESFGCRVIYYSTSGNHHTDRFPERSLAELLAESDIVSIHCPLTAATGKLIGEQQLRMMKRDAILLNLGRGPIVDEDALAKALIDGEIGGAGLDVLVKEPMDPGNPLLAIQDSTKLVITPHIAWATVEARTRCVDETVENVRAFLEGRERNVVRG
ncbi:MAG: D-2-hydroxyacid dehydrogenase [Lachnospiraceae bacterium]|nr:D-2-hydroxyacid dehydrogenase [Lachnospiraceae bacterium]